MALPCGMDPARARAAHRFDREDVNHRPALVLAPSLPIATTAKAKRYTQPKPLSKLQELTQRVGLLERQVREHIELLAAYETRINAIRRRRR